MEYIASWDAFVYLLGLAAMWGSLQSRLKALERKVEKHNNLVERMYQIEERTEQGERRLNELERLHQRGG